MFSYMYVYFYNLEKLRVQTHTQIHTETHIHTQLYIIFKNIILEYYRYDFKFYICMYIYAYKYI